MPDSQNSFLRKRRITSEDLQKLAESRHLYAVIDSCSVPLLPKKALELGIERAISLYRETPQQDFWDIAPYLVSVDKGFLEWLGAKSAKQGWGIFLASKEDLSTLRHHLRHFLKVREPEGEVWLFRFYDPRVLPHFFNGCSSNELRVFFGPVLAYGISDDAGAVSFYQEKQIAATPPLQPRYDLLFQLRDEHIRAMSPAIEADFRRRIKFHLRDEHGPAVEDMDERILEDRISLGLDRARTYGISSEVNLVTFVALMFEIAPEFDMQPTISRVLHDTQEEDVDVRMNSLFRVLSQNDWEEAERLKTPDSWEHLCNRAGR